MVLLWPYGKCSDRLSRVLPPRTIRLETIASHHSRPILLVPDQNETSDGWRTRGYANRARILTDNNPWRNVYTTHPDEYQYCYAFPLSNSWDRFAYNSAIKKERPGRSPTIIPILQFHRQVSTALSGFCFGPVPLPSFTLKVWIRMNLQKWKRNLYANNKSSRVGHVLHNHFLISVVKDTDVKYVLLICKGLIQWLKYATHVVRKRRGIKRIKLIHHHLA